VQESSCESDYRKFLIQSHPYDSPPVLGERWQRKSMASIGARLEGSDKWPEVCAIPVLRALWLVF